MKCFICEGPKCSDMSARAVMGIVVLQYALGMLEAVETVHAAGWVHPACLKFAFGFLLLPFTYSLHSLS